jgi:hypothetical protein
MDELEHAVLVQTAAIARACRFGDPVAERSARCGLAAAMLARDISRAHRAGLRFTPAQVEALQHLLSAMAGPADPPSSGGVALARFHDVIVEAERSGDGSCDRCGGPEATVSATMDLTGTENPPIKLERLCADCRMAGARS